MVTEEATESTTSEMALARSALYGVIASVFRRPDDPLFRTFSSHQEQRALTEAIGLLGAGGFERMQSAISHLCEAAEATNHDTRMFAFVQLFGHTARGVVPPYETEYGTGGPFFQPQEMSDIVGFYRAFGLDLDPRRHERLDHMSCEAEFMCFLCAKEAYAADAGDASTAQAVRRAQRLFMRDHLSAFAQTVFANMARQASAIWHAAAAEFGSAFIESECAYLDLPLGRTYLSLRQVEDVAVPMACGNCEGTCGAEAPAD